MVNSILWAADGSGSGGVDNESATNDRKDAGSAGLAAQQVKALLKRNLIDRRRTKNTTFCELCSPILLLSVLVYGYSLSDVLMFPEKVYSSVRLELPGGLGSLVPLLRSAMEVLEDEPTSAGPDSEGPARRRNDGPGRGPDEGDEDLLNYHDVERVFDQVTRQMDGPFAVPDMDTYISVGSVVANNLDEGAYEQVMGNMESGWTFGNLITQGTLHFAPAGDPVVSELISWLSNTSSGFDIVTHRVHESEEEAVSYALGHLEERTWAVIAVNEAETGKVDYTIRMNLTVLPNTNEVVDMISVGLDDRFHTYYLSGFLTLQTTIDRFFFGRSLPHLGTSAQGSEGDGDWSGGSDTCIPPRFIGVPFPTAAYDQNLFYAAVGYLLGLAMTMSTMYPLSRLVKSVVEEKETRVRETMRIMGLQTWTHELSWWITGVAVFTFIALSVSTLLSWSFLPLADGSLLLCYMISFTLSEVSLALMIASVFSKAKLASIAAPCVLFAGVLPRYIFYGSNRHEAPRSKMFASLLSPTAFTFGADFIADYEYAGVGATWSNFSEGEYSLQTSISVMFLDAALYGFLAWYLDKVVPGEYGPSRDPIGCLWAYPKACVAHLARRIRLTCSRGWSVLPSDSLGVDGNGSSSAGGGTHGAGGTVEGVVGDFEPLSAAGGGDGEHEGAPSGVSISRLRKEFGSKVAVAGLDLELLPGHITCILGHNGAGKSTTISMLTGQLKPTGGDAIVWGRSIRDNLPEVRQNMGICPQHDALMPLLTAREHLELYMDIKGMRQDMKGPLVSKTLEEVGLLEKEHTLASHLSGGQKRKLSVALALTGSPMLCILDEPTSGMDPYSRRFTWELLRRGRRGRCTLLSTHFMEEAEHLGDRVAILRQGKLRCVGSPLFLKSRFGLGYKLTLVKAGEAFDEGQLAALVRKYVTMAELLSSAGGEISFRLPRDEAKNFHRLFRELEDRREAMGVGGYGISITSLEEVFLSLEKEGGSVEGDTCVRTIDRDGSSATSNVGGDKGSEGDHVTRRFGRVEGAGGVSREGVRGPEDATSVSEIEMHPMAVASSASRKKVKGNGGSPTRSHEPFREQNAFRDEDEMSLLRGVGERSEVIRSDLSCDQPEGRGPGGDGGIGRRRRSRVSTRCDGEEKTGVMEQDNVSLPVGPKRDGGVSLREQFAWMLWKRRVVALRDWKGGLYQVLLPALLVALVLMLLTIDLHFAGPSLAMSADMFGGPTQVLFTEGEGKSSPYARVADDQDWTRLAVDDPSGLQEATSTGISHFLLDTYNDHGGGGGDARPARYGAYVFGDRIPLNVTVDWDEVRDHPETLEMALEIAGEALPSDGGEFDLKELMETAGLDNKQLAKALLGFNDSLPANETESFEEIMGFLWPTLNLTTVFNTTEGVAVNASRGAVANWTAAWLYLEYEDPTVSFSEAEYLQGSSELKLEGVVISARNESLELGEVIVSVDEVLQAMPPGTRTYDQGHFDLTKNTTTVMFNTSAPHALSAWVGEVTSQTFRTCAKQRGFTQEEASFVTRNHPLPLTARESLEVQTMLSLLVSLLVTIPFCYAPAAFVTFLVKERVCKSKRVQLVSGASPLAYWLSAYVWDVLLFFVLSILVMLSFVAYGKDASKVFTMHWDAFLGTWGLVVCYGLSALPLSYLYAFGFDGPSTAQISITGVNFLSGFGFVIAYGVLSSLRKTAKIAEKAKHFFRLFPPYLLGDGLIKVSSEFYLREVMGLKRSVFGVLAWDVAGMGIVLMLLEALLYFALVLAVEYILAAGVRSRLDSLRLRLGGWSGRDLANMLADSYSDKEDADVRKERLRVDGMVRAMQEGTATESRGVVDTVLIQGLAKVYPAPMSSRQREPKCAVRGLNLGVKKGECFGLLGINGAGKSTTLQILTRDLQATSGNLRVEGKPISSGAVCRLLGYCPQSDPLLDLMTVRETLLLFGGLKGVGLDESSHGSVEAEHSHPPSPTGRRGRRRVGLEQAARKEAQNVRLGEAAAAAMSAVGLGPTEKQLAGTLSGGNKRKLSLAIALIGEPPVLLLDEPSSGMDPGARRSMWEVISSLSRSRCVILTTHSMEECEAVCDKMGIMVGGRLRCIGTSQHLKARFGGGYSIEVRCPTDSMPAVTALIRKLSPLARVEEMHPMLGKFSIPAGGAIYSGDEQGVGRGGKGSSEAPASLSLAAAFESIEAVKEELELWDYSINQATLETIFMSFAKEQEEETTYVPGVAYLEQGTGESVTHVGGADGRDDSVSPAEAAGNHVSRASLNGDVEMGLLGDWESAQNGSQNTVGV